MLDGGPYVLKRGAHLYLKAYGVELWHLGIVDDGLRQLADVMQGVIAEAVHLVQLALVYRLFPVDVEGAFYDGGHFVDVVGIEGDDAQAYDIGDGIDVGIFGTLELQFAAQGVALLDAVLDGGDVDALFSQCVSQTVVGQLIHPLIDGELLVVLTEQLFSMRV